MFKATLARKVGNYYPFWKFEFFNPLIYVDLEVEKISEEFDLIELKKNVLRIIKRDKQQWTNYGDLVIITSSIQESNTHRDLIEIIGKYVHPLPNK